MFNLFKSSHRLLSTLATQKANEAGQVILYFWEPYPKAFLGLRNKPLFGRLSGGNTGHLSMQVNYSDNSQDYISVWPQPRTLNMPGIVDEIKPIINSGSLALDIKAESDKQPLVKSLPIDKNAEEVLKKHIAILHAEFKKDPEERAEWAITRNCATFIAEILYDSGIIPNKPTLITTPSSVYHMVDPLEQKAYLENYQRPSFKD